MRGFRLNQLLLKAVGISLLVVATSSWGLCDIGNAADDWKQQRISDEEESSFLSVQPIYFGEVFTNARGGKFAQGATQYLGLLNLEFGLDLQKSGLKLPGRLFVLAQNTHGRGLTEDFVGDTQVISNIDSFRNIAQIGEYWWETSWLDDDVTIRLGKQDINTEFQNIEGAGYFIQSTFGLSPSTAFPTYPDQALGAVALFQLRESLQLKMGAWSAFARGSTWGLSDSGAYLVVGELERRYALAGELFPGVIAVGALYESAGVLDGQSVSAVREYFVQWEQSLYRERPWDEDCNQGLAAFAGYYPRFPGDQPITKSIGDSAVGGFTYTGLMPGRDNDVLGVGLAWSELFQGGTNREMATELFYRAVWSQKLSFQPDIQYISSPSGIFKDALAIGIRLELRP